MHIGITWSEIALRLACTVIAGALIGINRGEHGRAAGLRTTLLVCLAASLAMIQANLLLNVSGKTPDSFVVMDVMRLPLGILSGMGFIGAGAILRRENRVLGITTAATLWFVTVMGLCFGGGQIALGAVALALGMFILTGLKWVEVHWQQERHATLMIVLAENKTTESEISQAFIAARCKINFSSVSYGADGKILEFTCTIQWRGRASEITPPEFLKEISQRFHFTKMDWHLLGAP